MTPKDLIREIRSTIEHHVENDIRGGLVFEMLKLCNEFEKQDKHFESFEAGFLVGSNGAAQAIAEAFHFSIGRFEPGSETLQFISKAFDKWVEESK